MGLKLIMIIMRVFLYTKMHGISYEKILGYSVINLDMQEVSMGIIIIMYM